MGNLMIEIVLKHLYIHDNLGPCTLAYCKSSDILMDGFQRKVKVKVVQSCPTLCDPMDFIVHGILQARILEW